MGIYVFPEVTARPLGLQALPFVDKLAEGNLFAELHEEVIVGEILTTYMET